MGGCYCRCAIPGGTHRTFLRGRHVYVSKGDSSGELGQVPFEVAVHLFVDEQRGKVLNSGEPPFLFPAGRYDERVHIKRCGPVCARRAWGGKSQPMRVRGICSCFGVVSDGQPTDPSIWSSMRRFSSSAYSMGSSRAMGSMNPRTIMAMASNSSIPRDMR